MRFNIFFLKQICMFTIVVFFLSCSGGGGGGGGNSVPDDPNNNPDPGEVVQLPAQFDLANLGDRASLEQGIALPHEDTPNFGFVDVGQPHNIEVGDLNNDGVDDIILGSGTPRKGEVFVVFGGQNLEATFTLSSLKQENGGNGSRGFRINQASSGSRSGIALKVGDINNDRIDDIVIGAPSDSEVYVVFGGQNFGPEFFLADLKPENGGNGQQGFLLNSPIAGLGESLATADFNGDSIDDLILGAPSTDSNGIEDSGEVYVVFGGQNLGAAFDLSNLDPANGGNGFQGIVFRGVEENGNAGFFLTTGNINNDENLDILIRSNEQVFIVFGGQLFGADFALSQLLNNNGGDGTKGFVLNGSGRSRTGDSFATGDINNDNIDDIIVSQTGLLAGNDLRALAFVVFGGQNLGAEFDVNQIEAVNGGDGTQGFVVEARIQVLLTMATSGLDINNDGIDDVTIGANSLDLNENNKTEMYVILGGQEFGVSFDVEQLFEVNGGDGSKGIIFEGRDTNDGLSSTPPQKLDFNQDNFPDLILHAPKNGGTGESYLIFLNELVPAKK